MYVKPCPVLSCLLSAAALRQIRNMSLTGSVSSRTLIFRGNSYILTSTQGGHVILMAMCQSQMLMLILASCSTTFLFMSMLKGENDNGFFGTSPYPMTLEFIELVPS